VFILDMLDGNRGR